MGLNLDKRCTVFVYGTLMRGFGNERVIAGFPHENYPATVTGVEMYDVGYFPAMVKGDHTYQGELVVFDLSCDRTHLFQRMDMLEGYREHDPESSMYVRAPIDVEVDGELIETEVYLWNRETGGLHWIDPDVFPDYRSYCSTRR